MNSIRSYINIINESQQFDEAYDETNTGTIATQHGKQIPYKAVKDATKRTQANLEKLPDAMVILGRELLGRAKEGFFRRKCYLNAAKGHIYVKVKGPTPSDKLSPEFEAFEDWALSKNIKKKINSEGDYLYYVTEEA